MRVLHVIGCYPPAVEWGGAASAAASLVEAAAGAGVECEVLTTTQRGTRALPRLPTGPSPGRFGTVHWFPSIHRLGRGFVAPSLAPAIWRMAPRFDVVHLHMMWTFPTIVAAWACRARGVPYVVSTHGAVNPWGLSQRSFEKKVFLAVAERKNLSSAALVHFTAQGEREAAPAWVRALPGVVIANPVDGRAFERLGDRATRAASREVLVLGRIHEVKGFDVLLPAWREVVAAEPGARLVVAGPDEGGYLGTVRALASELGIAGSVRFTGVLDAAGRAAALESAALLVAPSRQENFGMAIAEAMAAGLPVVVSDQVNTGVEIAAAGAGVVVPCDPAPLASAILGLLRDPARRDEMGSAGRRLVRERYAMDRVGAALRAAYERAASDSADAGRGRRSRRARSPL